MSDPTRYPLAWPSGRRRTHPGRRERARFDTSLADARDGLLREVAMMGGSRVVLSMNVPLRNDGLPYSRHPVPPDPGVAVYFARKGRSLCVTCDRWNLVKDNFQAIRRTLEAIRGIERWATVATAEQAFEGYAALPAPSGGRSIESEGRSE